MLDTRMSSVLSLRSFFSALPSLQAPVFLVPLIALYDALNDDDEAIRGLAAAACAPILGSIFAPISAAPALLGFISEKYGNNSEFKAITLNRVVGDNSLQAHDWLSARTQLREKIPADLSLFLVEEPNLFIDEVREAQRWTGVFGRLSYTSADLAALREWILEGLDALVEMCVEEEDGPLGWTSKPQVFAICSSIVLGASALSKHVPVLKEKLQQFRDVALRHGVHEILVEMASS